ncbi:hypothetical protein [Mesorhizobium sp. GbtcB19]|uniref:hypothetical protein n=1 Tax=Mesorhizobium sp. GbtcB19 TaxID=2824764 RepID=UPI001C2FABB2|nr:hypothetical protein [Mesorhizobium sp. GbtcB19]
MASSEFVITKEQYEITLRTLINSGSRISYDVFDGTKIRYLNADSVAEVIGRRGAAMALKHPSFATDEPEVVIYKNGDTNWYQFKELHGDGHIKINSRKFTEDPYFYFAIGYTSFFVTKNGTHIQPPKNLIEIYKTAVRSIKSLCRRELIGSVKSVYVSKAILDSDPRWLSAVRIHFGII